MPTVEPAPTANPYVNSTAPLYPSSASPISSWGNVYKTPGDMPVGKQIYILPKKDYVDACYVWAVPNGEVIIPGSPLYRLPSEKTILNDAFGFEDEDSLEDFGVLAVDSCSDWKKYVKERSAGNWQEIQKQILQSAVPVQSAAPTPAPTGWNWEDCTKIMGAFTITPAKGASKDEKAAIGMTNAVVQQQIPVSADPITSLIPSLNFMTYAANGIDAANGQGEVNGALDAYWVFVTPNQIQALVSALGWTDNKAVLKKLYSFYNGNADPIHPYINLSAAFPASSVIGFYTSQTGVGLSSSNCTVTFTLLEAINYSIAKFAL